MSWCASTNSLSPASSPIKGEVWLQNSIKMCDVWCGISPQKSCPDLCSLRIVTCFWNIFCRHRFVVENENYLWKEIFWLKNWTRCYCFQSRKARPNQQKYYFKALKCNLMLAVEEVTSRWVCVTQCCEACSFLNFKKSETDFCCLLCHVAHPTCGNYTSQIWLTWDKKVWFWKDLQDDASVVTHHAQNTSDENNKNRILFATALLESMSNNIFNFLFWELSVTQQTSSDCQETACLAHLNWSWGGVTRACRRVSGLCRWERLSCTCTSAFFQTHYVIFALLVWISSSFEKVHRPRISFEWNFFFLFVPGDSVIHNLLGSKNFLKQSNRDTRGIPLLAISMTSKGQIICPIFFVHLRFSEHRQWNCLQTRLPSARHADHQNWYLPRTTCKIWKHRAGFCVDLPTVQSADMCASASVELPSVCGHFLGSGENQDLWSQEDAQIYWSCSQMEMVYHCDCWHHDHPCVYVVRKLGFASPTTDIYIRVVERRLGLILHLGNKQREPHVSELDDVFDSAFLIPYALISCCPLSFVFCVIRTRGRTTPHSQVLHFGPLLHFWTSDCGCVVCVCVGGGAWACVYPTPPREEALLYTNGTILSSNESQCRPGSAFEIAVALRNSPEWRQTSLKPVIETQSSWKMNCWKMNSRDWRVQDPETHPEPRAVHDPHRAPGPRGLQDPEVSRTQRSPGPRGLQDPWVVFPLDFALELQCCLFSFNQNASRPKRLASVGKPAPTGPEQPAASVRHLEGEVRENLHDQSDGPRHRRGEFSTITFTRGWFFGQLEQCCSHDQPLQACVQLRENPLARCCPDRPK